ncbi:uncharacterized protein BDZ99DRAFT_470868 [Mytilinidion resinicola]|uniref:RING-type domain-containing protein n=1 Tax=Mytilinidion resinicola TaxID=574789 RepID=A0A6A6ZB45_9PEZI|nr:uncharacterized protein BDZ99DRAFT_470868 [Mytilinidion resinicola]KAF2817923.1 hypothetical protein BDZ99DRAFT_470868 [Mytilinidion resinicola]
MPTDEVCPICRDPFATTFAERKRFVDEMTANGFDCNAYFGFDIAYKLPCGHAMGLLCTERWLHTDVDLVCPSCTQDPRTPIHGLDEDKWPIVFDTVWCEADPEYHGDPTYYERIAHVVGGLADVRMRHCREFEERERLEQQALLEAARREPGSRIRVWALAIGVVSVFGGAIFEIVRLEYLKFGQVCAGLVLVVLGRFVPQDFWQI